MGKRYSHISVIVSIHMFSIYSNLSASTCTAVLQHLANATWCTCVSQLPFLVSECTSCSVVGGCLMCTSKQEREKASPQ